MSAWIAPEFRLGRSEYVNNTSIVCLRNKFTSYLRQHVRGLDILGHRTWVQATARYRCDDFFASQEPSLLKVVLKLKCNYNSDLVHFHRFLIISKVEKIAPSNSMKVLT